jgi:GxxExxY protein
MAEILFKELSFAVVGAAMEVHSILGAGFLEKVYQRALAHELKTRGIPFQENVPLPVTYKGVLVGEYIADIIVDEKIILELKSVSGFHAQHEAQAHNYLAATGYRLAILLNFGTSSLEQKRVIR